MARASVACSSSVHEGDLVVADDAGRVDADPRKVPDDHDELILRVVRLDQVEYARVGTGEEDVGEGGIIAVDALPDAPAVLLVGSADPCWREARLVVEPGEVPCPGFGVCLAAGWLCGHAYMVACQAGSGGAVLEMRVALSGAGACSSHFGAAGVAVSAVDRGGRIDRMAGEQQAPLCIDRGADHDVGPESELGR